jgi:RHS repeat-associated protein
LYQYNGKELVEDNGLGWNHYGARAYDPAVGRWWVVDPKIGLYYSSTPFAFCLGNPLSLIDFDGAQVTGDFYSSSGKHLGSDGKSDGKVYVFAKNSDAKKFKKEVKTAVKNGQSKESAVAAAGQNLTKVTLDKNIVAGVLQSFQSSQLDTSPGANDAGLHEEGGHATGTLGSSSVTYWQPGPKKKEGEKAKTYLFNGLSAPTSSDILAWWHTHPTTVITDSYTGREIKSSSEASDHDETAHRGLTADKFSGLSIIIGGHERQVRFFDQNGTQLLMSIHAFTKIK